MTEDRIVKRLDVGSLRVELRRRERSPFAEFSRAYDGLIAAIVDAWRLDLAALMSWRYGPGLALLAFCLLLAAALPFPARADPDAESTKPAIAEEAPRYASTGRGSRWEVMRWASMLEEYDDWDVQVALRVIDCESEGNPAALNPWSGAKSLFQLLGWEWLAARLYGTRDVFIARVNIGVAHYLWREHGAFGWFDSHGRPRGHWAASIYCWGG
jgi:hypothetical protein